MAPNIVYIMVRSSLIAFIALSASGGRKACTPFEMASMPVTATQPPANARRIWNTPTLLTRVPRSPFQPKPASGCVGGCQSPCSTRSRPTPITRYMAPMKPYVGAEKMAPDSRTPRRFTRAITQTAIRARRTSYSRRRGIAEVMAATPAAALTATVST
jgi:hypothetical protein